MEGIGTWQPTPAGYLNSTTAFFYPRPEITGEVLTLNQVYVSPQGSDDVANNGVITSPFATISAALFYVTNVLDQPLTIPVCIFVAPGQYEGGFTVPDNVYLIGPSNSPQPVVITGNVFVAPSATSGTIGLQNITFQGVTVAGAFFDANLEMRNCTIETNTVFSALTIAPESGAINVRVNATECIFNATDSTNVAVISGNTSELVRLVLDNCQLTTAGVEGSLIDMTGFLTVRNSTLLNTAAGTTLAPLIILQSGATLTPVVSIEGSVLKYNSLATDTGGDKLAIRFNAATQPITASMTNCTISVQLGGGNTNIVENIGAELVAFTQSANSCLLDGKNIDTLGISLIPVAFLDDSPGGGGGAGVTSLAGLTGAVTLSSPDSSITITPAGGDIALTAVAPVTSVGGKTGAVTFATGEGIAIDYGAENADPITISSSVVGIDTSGTVDATGFTEQEDGPYIGQYYKDVTVTGLYANGVVVCSTSGTPEISAIAWITTVVLATNKITIWTAADPVGGGGTWEAHYIVASYGSAPPPP
jgi:hypothetical protein